MSRFSSLLRFLTAALLMCGAWWLIRWGETPSQKEQDGGSAPSMRIEGAQNIVLREKGRRVWSLDARRITISADRRHVEATGVTRATVFREDKPWLHLQAERVRLNQETRDLEATGRIAVRGPDGFTLQTAHASWKHTQGRLSCPEGATATLRGLNIEAPFVFYDARKSRLHCPRTVVVFSSDVTLRGQNVVVDTKTRQVQNQGEAEFVFHNLPDALNLRRKAGS